MRWFGRHAIFWGRRPADISENPAAFVLGVVVGELLLNAYVVLGQLLLVLTCKSVWRSTFQSIRPVTIWMGGALLMAFSLLLLGHYLPVMSAVLQLERVGRSGWLGFLLTSLALLFLNELLKFGKRRTSAIK